MTTMTTQEASAKISELVSQSYALLTEAESIADEHNLAFGFDPAYGMGGYYDGEEGEWNASSQSC